MTAQPNATGQEDFLSRGSGARLLAPLARLLLHSRGASFVWLFATAAFVAALVIRLAVDEWLPPGFPFLTFFPAVLITAVFASIRAGVAVAVAGGIASWFFFIAPTGSFYLNSGTFVALAFYVLITATELVFIAATHIALRRLRDAQRQTQQMARGRELLLAEMQHRVSNNLATVAALLRAQSSQLAEGPARTALTAAQQRIMTISRLQRRLHRPDVQDIELAEYLPEIARDTAEAAGLPADIVEVDVMPARVSQDQAIPLGLIVCEVLLNAFEHAGGGPDFQVRLGLHPCPVAEGDRLAVTIADNGPGLPDGFDLEQVGSLGLSVARQFAQTLGGALTLEDAPGGGTLARVVFERKQLA